MTDVRAYNGIIAPTSVSTLSSVPAAVIVGRPNVGKSLLFNRLCGRRAAIVHDAPGMTLDYLCETARLGDGRAINIIDTGGVAGAPDAWSDAILQRMTRAAEQADIILAVVDAVAGVQHGDAELLTMLRRRWPDRPRLLLANKCEGLPAAQACADFYQFKEDTLPVSAKRGDGMDALRERLAAILPEAEESPPAPPLAIIGRPNVGKSTLMNCLLKQDRVLVSATPGTTRDNVRAVLSSSHGDFALIDTAGMRRRRAATTREKFSVSAARAAVQQSAVTILLWDMHAGPGHQDKRLAAMLADAGCGVVLAGNKSDLLPPSRRRKTVLQQAREMSPGFAAQAFAISAAEGNISTDKLLAAAKQAAQAAQARFSTAHLNRALSEAVRRNPPPMTGGIRPKLRYIHQGGQSPLRVVIHGGGVARIADDYKRYLSAAIARRLSLVGAPLRVDFRAEDNPYAPR